MDADWLPDRNDIKADYIQHTINVENNRKNSSVTKKEETPSSAAACEVHAFFLYCVHSVAKKISESNEHEFFMPGKLFQDLATSPDTASRFQKKFSKYSADMPIMIPWQVIIVMHQRDIHMGGVAPRTRLVKWIQHMQQEWSQAENTTRP